MFFSSSFRRKLPSHLHIKENSPPFKDMINISCFFYLAKVFGLAPYTLQVGVKHSRLVSAFIRAPTFLMILLYAVLVCSIFWKNQAVSEISNTVNWIQVNFYVDGKMFSVTRISSILLLHPQFIPNATIFFIILVSAENSRSTVQSVGILIHVLDQKLRLFKVSFAGSNKRTKRLSLFASFRKIKAEIYAIKIELKVLLHSQS